MSLELFEEFCIVGFIVRGKSSEIIGRVQEMLYY
jgi:hypothetical protein